MRRKLIISIIALAVIGLATMAPSAGAKQLTTGQLKAHLREARHSLAHARQRAREAVVNAAGARELRAITGGATTPAPGATPTPGAKPLPAVAIPAGMDATLAASLLADGVVTDQEVAVLQTRAHKALHVAHRRAVKVRRIARQLRLRRQIATWARTGRWRPLIEIAGRTYGVSPSGLYRLMILESGGQRTVGSTYKGLFQYYPSTWTGSWNPWRHESIFNGWAQIRATAYALSRGMGPSQWPNTYPMAF